MNTSAFGVEKGVLFRTPATANLMIDSNDRVNLTTTTPWDFLINKPQNLIQGFFTRVGVTEVCLDWCLPNISAAIGNNTFKITELSGVPIADVSGTVTLLDNCYTMEECLDAIVSQLNAKPWATYGVPGTSFSISLVNNAIQSLACNRLFKIGGTVLTDDLAIPSGSIGVAGTNLLIPCCADLRPYRYIDIVSDTLTSVQDVKDASTANFVKDVICRWYFNEDTQETYDAYGFPIYMGYQPFSRRRIYSPPKQIKWEQNKQVGQLSFQVYDDAGNLITTFSPSYARHLGWRMTLQLTEG